MLRFCPDYRSPGRPKYNPINFQDFLTSPATRRRYWARSMAGYKMMSQAKPNDGHIALAGLHRLHVNNNSNNDTDNDNNGNNNKSMIVVTQNVDGLHQKGGLPEKDVIELHGSVHRVECLECKATLPRTTMQEMLEHANPSWLTTVDSHRIRNSTIMIDKVTNNNNNNNNNSNNNVNYNKNKNVIADPSYWSDKSATLNDANPDTLNNIMRPNNNRPDGDVELSVESYDGFVIPTCPFARRMR